MSLGLFQDGFQYIRGDGGFSVAPSTFQYLICIQIGARSDLTN